MQIPRQARHRAIQWRGLGKRPPRRTISGVFACPVSFVRPRCALTFAAFAFGAAHADTAVFINEIHYDDSTARAIVNEGVEVAAPAGTDLTGWKLVPYTAAAARATRRSSP
jgi:hypothetical protein